MSRDESKLELEKRNLELKNEQLMVETRKLEHEVAEQAIVAARAEFYWRWEDDKLRVYRFNDEVNGLTAMHCIRFLNRQLAQCPVTRSRS